MRKRIKRITLSIILLIILVCVVLCIVNRYTYKKIKLDKSPDAVFSSAHTNYLVTVIDGKIILYDEAANEISLDTPFVVTYAYPLEDTLWVIDDNGNLYEVSYEAAVSDVVLTDVKYINMATKNYTAITTSGKLYVWGDNIGHRLGLADKEYIDRPTEIDSINDAKETAISYGNTLVLLEDGTVYAAGEVYKEDYMESVDNLTEYTLMDELINVKHLYNSDLCVSATNDGISSWSYIYKDFEEDKYKVKPITSVDDFLCNKEPIFCSAGEGFTAYLTAKGDVYYWGEDFLATPDCKCDPYAIPCEIVPYIDEVDMIYSGRDVLYAKKELNFYIIKK